MDYVKQEVEVNATTITIDWLKLPEHITYHIMSKLISIYDYASFSAVCVQWQSIFHGTKESLRLHSQVPLLMIPSPPLPPAEKKKKKSKYSNSKKKNKKKDTISCSFYRVTDGKIFNRLQLAMPRNRYVRGSGYGWLITVDEDQMCFSIQLMNPFFYPNYNSNKEIKLPPLITHPHPLEEDDPEFINYTHLRKAILSADPISNPKDFMVMAIFFGLMGLAFCNPGDEAWTPIQTDSKLRGMFYDLVYYQGKFYALHCSGTIVVCNVEKRTMETFARPPLPVARTRKKYLVISEGELFQVHRYVDNFNNSKRFRVFKLQRRELAAATDDWVDWEVVKDLCGRVFFVGDNSSISISASDFPGCKPNRIYYTDDDIDNQWWYRHTPGYGPRDLGVFNVQNGSFERHYPTDFELWPNPLWIEPTLMRRSNDTCSKPNVVKKRIV